MKTDSVLCHGAPENVPVSSSPAKNSPGHLQGTPGTITIIQFHAISVSAPCPAIVYALLHSKALGHIRIYTLLYSFIPIYTLLYPFFLLFPQAAANRCSFHVVTPVSRFSFHPFPQPHPLTSNPTLALCPPGLLSPSHSHAAPTGKNVDSACVSP